MGEKMLARYIEHILTRDHFERTEAILISFRSLLKFSEVIAS